MRTFFHTHDTFEIICLLFGVQGVVAGVERGGGRVDKRLGCVLRGATQKTNLIAQALTAR